MRAAEKDYAATLIRSFELASVFGVQHCLSPVSLHYQCGWEIDYVDVRNDRS